MMLGDPQLKLGERIAESDDAPGGYRAVMDAYALARPCVITLGGDDAITDTLANRICKNTQLLLGRENIHNDEIKLYTVTYSQYEDEDDCMDRTNVSYYYNAISRSGQRQSAENRFQYPREIQDFVTRYMLPLVAKNYHVDGDFHITGRRLAVEEAKHNLRNLNFVANSYGTMIANEISDVLANALTQLGYEKNEIQELASQIFLLSIADITPIKAPKPAHFTTLHLLNMSDSVAAAHCGHNMADVVHMLESQQMSIPGDSPATRHPKELAISQVPDTTNIWVASVDKILPMRRWPKWEVADDPKQHLLATHTRPGIVNGDAETPESFSPNGFMLPALAAATLRNAVSHSVQNAKGEYGISFPDIKSLFKMPTSVAFETIPNDPYRIVARANGYNERIDILLGEISKRPVVVGSVGQR